MTKAQLLAKIDRLEMELTASRAGHRTTHCCYETELSARRMFQRERDDAINALTECARIFSRISHLGHRTGYDWNADPEKLTLAGSYIFEYRDNPDRATAAIRRRDRCVIDYMRQKLCEFGFEHEILDAMERDAINKAGIDA